MENYNFPAKAEIIEIKLGGITTRDVIDIKRENDTNTYRTVLEDIERISKLNKEVIIGYREYLIAADGTELALTPDTQYFNAGEQENFPYFYNMIVGNLTLGTTLDKMIADGYLIFKKKVSLGVFGSNGQFFKPIILDTQVITQKNGKFTIDSLIANAIEEEATFTITELGVSNTTGLFTDLEAGKYTLFVESPTTMAAIEKVVVGEV